MLEHSHMYTQTTRRKKAHAYTLIHIYTQTNTLK